MVPESTLALARACATNAEASADLLLECWADGSFATFDYNCVQHLFADSTILAMSNLLKITDASLRGDGGRFDSVCEIMYELSNGGHLGAAEFCRQLETIQSSIVDLNTKRHSLGGLMPVGPAFQDETPVTGSETDMTSEDATGGSAPGSFLPSSLDLHCIEDLFSQDMSQGLYWPSFDHAA